VGIALRRGHSIQPGQVAFQLGVVVSAPLARLEVLLNGSKVLAFAVGLLNHLFIR
jgi:hypothetical protein